MPLADGQVYAGYTILRTPEMVVRIIKAVAEALDAHTNPAVVISQHLNTPPPAIGTRRPALSGLGPVFSTALAKAPDARYRTCVEFADTLAMRLGTLAAETGATEVTAVSLDVSGVRRHAPRRSSNERVPAHWKLVIAATLTGLVIVAIVAILVALNVL
jgi:serine/threonine protein kinase, bacterial